MKVVEEKRKKGPVAKGKERMKERNMLVMEGKEKEKDASSEKKVKTNGKEMV